MSKENSKKEKTTQQEENISPVLVSKIQSKLPKGIVSRLQPKMYTNYKRKEEPVAEKKSSATIQLPKEVQAKMENSFNQDFSNINIHKDSSSAKDINAKAYAQGTDVHFAPGEYNPTSKEGQELIGHELTHVVQQGQGKVGQGEIHGKGLEINQDVSLEKEADEAGRLASEGKSVNVYGNANGIQRKEISEKLDFTGIANKIHKAIDGLGTNEKEVYDALRLLKRDEKNISCLKLRYQELFHVTLIQDITEDFSGSELEEALSFLKPYYPSELSINPDQSSSVSYGEIKDQAIQDGSYRLGNLAENKSKNILNKMSSEGYMKTNTDKLVKTSRFKNVINEAGEVVKKPVNFGWKQNDVVHTTKGIELHTSKTTNLKNIGAALKYVGEFMNLISLARIAMGKEELYTALDIIAPLSFISEGQFEEIDRAHIKACLQQGYGATKEMVENSRTFPGKIVYASAAEIIKLHQKQITSVSQFADPYNSSLEYALLVNKGKDFIVYGGFYIKK